MIRVKPDLRTAQPGAPYDPCRVCPERGPIRGGANEMARAAVEAVAEDPGASDRAVSACSARSAASAVRAAH